MNLGVLCSGGGSAIPFFDAIPGLNIVAGATSHIGKCGSAKLTARKVPTLERSIHDFYLARGKRLRDMDVRAEWDSDIESFMATYGVEMLACSGYMYLLTNTITKKYVVLNVHPADLRIQDKSGKRCFTGANAVLDALTAGETETRSTIHIMDDQVDGGPIIVVSPPVPVDSDLMSLVSEGTITLEAAASIHQEYMKYFADGPAYAMALGLMAKGDLQVSADRMVYFNGVGPLEAGLVMDKTFQLRGLEFAQPIIRKADEL
jgi:folate-dependent phosphoribosylglycinamide formyltransferase PurN